MQIHELTQGTPAWSQFRLEHFGASEAAAMLGLSSKVKRTELLHMKSTGTAKEFSEWVQENILDYGHEVEAMARPIIEAQIDDDLYPVTCSEGRLSASCDGLTMSGSTAFEHKQYNATLFAAVEFGELPEEYMPQCQQIMLVTGAKQVIFTCSDGTADRMAFLAVTPDPEWFGRISAGWEQFAKDLAEYQPRDLNEKPQGTAIMQLPALAVQIRGEVVRSNLPAFREAADQFIANIKTDLATDEDFADAEVTVKFCKTAEDDLESTKRAIIGQAASIDELTKTVDHIQSQLRAKRLALEKLVASKKTAIKEKILADAKVAYSKHLAALQLEILPLHLDLTFQPDFAGAAKSKRTLASLHDAVDTELANCKIKADAVAKDIRGKLAWLAANAEAYRFLFNDLQQLVTKADEDFQLVIKSRIADHKAAQERAEAETRARIAEEERRKAEAAADARVKAEAAAAAEKARAEAEAARPQPVAEAVASVETLPAHPIYKASAGGTYREPVRVATPAVQDRQLASLFDSAPATPTRPSDEAIIKVLIEHFEVPAAVIAEWLCEMDFSLPHAA